MTETILEKYSRLMKETDEIKSKYGEKLIKDNLDLMYNLIPGLEAIKWAQYTPYFNDGDTCTFARHEFRFKFEKESIDAELEDSSENSDGFMYRFYLDEKTDKTICSKIDLIESNLKDEFYLAVFGDHVEVTYDFKKFKIDEMDHE